VIFPGKLHISKSMEKVLKQNKFLVTINKDFQSVIKNCSKIKRPRQSGTWLTIDMINAYLELDRLGWVRSAEAFYEGELEGGCYGVRIGNVFFGESMFSKKTNASKAAFLTLAQVLFSDGVNIIDCQQHTRHLESLGAEEISRKEFLAILNKEFGGNSPDRSTLRR
jgi:leucyl/phenylalanyl-tRNA--protein transferase